MNHLANTPSPRVIAKRLLAAALLVLADPTLALAETSPTASLWSRLWRTPDQRGQALLQQGDAAGAVQAFADPEHKGHAALQAGDYNGAAQTLSNVGTAEAQYNRGNALAHAGDLQGAIQAYDAALKSSPQHADARHNRDVVSAALQKQQNEKKDSSQQHKQGKDADKPNDKPGDKSGDKPNNEKSGAQQGNTSGQKPGDKPGKDAAPTQAGEQPASAPQPGKAAAASTPKDDAAQARRDAETSLGKGAQPPPTQTKAGANDAAKLQTPQTEKQIAQEQWLRAIPDDPGGLLRRKFLIEHMLRQQGQKP